MSYILVLYHSRHGKTAELASHIARGIDLGPIESRVRTVSETDEVPQVAISDLANCSGLALGSPSYFGAIASPLKSFLETTSELWLNGSLVSKPAMVFSSSDSIHGGQESVLLSMMVPLLHHGMIIVGTPYTFSGLATTSQGGTPYGPTAMGKKKLTSIEIELAQKSGKRLSEISNKLK
ncbi:MAG: NAD(P)H-dependent oxidoreductase [Methylacidiphilales bacterium]|nr:NAD(P)H-dependent oxidoreductase [Candidatus Methylacidiphilales bacterium]